MADFHLSREVKCGRKEYRCESCSRKIEVGQPRLYAFGVWEGEIFAHDAHLECSAAERDLANTFDLWGDEWPWLRQISDEAYYPYEMLVIVRDRHPVAWERIKPGDWDELSAHEIPDGSRQGNGGG